MSTRITSFGHRIERFGYTLLGFCGAIGLLCLMKGTPVQAQAPGVNLTALYNQVQALQTRLAVVEGKTQYQSSDSTAQSTTFSGCNVVINDGGGSTSTFVTNTAGNGLGNLIIGYDETGNSFGDFRTGVHNLILGDANSYTSYGGLVAGVDNTITNFYASITGGNMNQATGRNSSISGGSLNQSTGSNTSISGGQFNLVSGTNTSISGGSNNTASNVGSSVSGGFQNQAIGSGTSISGGQNNLASGANSSISGSSGVSVGIDFGWSAGGVFHNP